MSTRSVNGHRRGVGEPQETVESRLVGRDRERDRLDVLIADLLVGRGSLTMITGPPGVGKTALLEELISAAQANGVLAQIARANELDRTLPFVVVRELLETAVLDGGGPAVHSAALELTESGPLLLMIDDAQWADPDSLHALVHLAHRLVDAPIAIVVAHGRAEAAELELLDRLAAVAGASSIVLAPLDDRDATALVRSIVPTAHDDLCERCQRAAAGVPLALVELARMVVAHGPGVLGADGYLQGELRCEPIERWVRRRLTALDPAARATVDAVAILGGGSAPRIAALAGLEPLDVLRARDRLIAVGLLADSSELAFASPIMHQAVGYQLPRADRAISHRRAAGVLLADDAPLDLVAGHLLLTDPAADAETVSVLRQAANAALNSGVPGSAVSFLRRAMVEPPAPSERPTLLAELATAEFTAGLEGAPGRLVAALARLEGPLERIEALTHLAALDVLQQRNSIDLDLVLAEAATAEDDELRLAAELATIDVLLMLPPRQAERQQRIARLAEPGEPVGPLERVALSHMAWLAAERGDEPHQRTVELATRALADDGLIAIGMKRAAFHIAVRGLIVADGLAAAQRHLERMIEATERAGSPRLTAACFQYLADVHLRAGRIDDCEAAARRALADAGEGDLVHGGAVEALVNALVERDRLAEAADVLREHRWDGELTDMYREIGLRLARARLALAAGDPRRALDDALACGRLRERQGRPNPAWTPWRTTAALAYLALGDTAAARELASEELTLARVYGAPRAIGIAARACALIADETSERLALLLEAVAVLEPSEARLEHARALATLGWALRRSGQRMEAREPLREALDLASRLGASAVASYARAELVATGLRPRRAAQTGPDALTPRQRRVCELAAAGRTNQAIAQELFISLKTVETHLGVAYRKLGVATKAELDAVLAGED